MLKKIIEVNSSCEPFRLQVAVTVWKWLRFINELTSGPQVSKSVHKYIDYFAFGPLQNGIDPTTSEVLDLLEEYGDGLLELESDNQFFFEEQSSNIRQAKDRDATAILDRAGFSAVQQQPSAAEGPREGCLRHTSGPASNVSQCLAATKLEMDQHKLTGVSIRSQQKMGSSVKQPTAKDASNLQVNRVRQNEPDNQISHDRQLIPHRHGAQQEEQSKSSNCCRQGLVAGQNPDLHCSGKLQDSSSRSWFK